MNFDDLVLTVEEAFRNEILAVFKIYSRVRVRVVAIAILFSIHSTHHHRERSIKGLCLPPVWDERSFRKPNNHKKTYLGHLGSMHSVLQSILQA